MATLTYYGHSCFMFTDDEGYRVVFDPYQDGSVPGLRLPHIEAEKVYASHGHADHNAVDAVTLTGRGTDPFTVSFLETDHDDQGGTLRGENRITILEAKGCRIAHFGDLGRGLTAAETAELKHCDLVMIPCGGHFTIDAGQAKEILREICPKLAVLMHYRDGRSGYDVLLAKDEVKKVFPEAQDLSADTVDPASVCGTVFMRPAQ